MTNLFDAPGFQPLWSTWTGQQDKSTEIQLQFTSWKRLLLTESKFWSSTESFLGATLSRFLFIIHDLFTKKDSNKTKILGEIELHNFYFRFATKTKGFWKSQELFSTEANIMKKNFFKEIQENFFHLFFEIKS